MKLLYFWIFVVAFIFSSPGFAKEHDLILRLRELGLDHFAKALTKHHPALIEEISKRNDITIWAPGNDAVARHPLFSNLGKRATLQEASFDAVVSEGSNNNTGGYDSFKPVTRGINKRHNDVGLGPRNYPGTNFEKIYTFLDDPDFVNLGKGQQLRFVKNFAPLKDGAVDSVAKIEVKSGLGATRNTVRGPFSFTNGVIYEMTDFPVLPATFTMTMTHLNISQQFLDAVVRTGNLLYFEDSPAVTIFAPLDSTFEPHEIDPKSHILWKKNVFGVFLTPDLYPATYITKSGTRIKITSSATGEPLVNCRRIVNANVVTKNGVIHFIEGPLDWAGKFNC